MTVVIWPGSVLRPTAVKFWLENSSKSGGRAVNGVERIAVRDPYWRGSVTVGIRGSAQIIMARAIFARLRGRANPLVMPAFDCGRSPGAVNYKLTVPTVPHSDGATFDDGTDYVGSAYPAVCTAGAANRATTITVTVAQNPGNVTPGTYFTIARRLYQISDVTVSGLDVTISFLPPLRGAVAAGTDVQFDSPEGTFRLSSDDQAALALDKLRFSEVTLDLVEYL